MRNFTLTFIALVLGLTNLFAQAPQTFKYQAVARDNLGKILVTQLVGLRISILKDSPLGATMYMETHTRGTNEYGIVTLNVGGGTSVTGNFNNINWSNGEYFIKTELDIAGTGNYIFIGSTQLLSVPFALHSEFATKAGKALNDQDTSITNELQTITKTGNSISLSQGGGSVDLSEYYDNTDNQTISLQGNQLTISNGNTLVLSGAVDLDSDPINEIQNLSIVHDTLRLSLSNEIKLPHDYLTYNDDTLKLSNSNQIIFPHDADRDSLNELQYLSFANDTMYLSKGNYVKLPYVKMQQMTTICNTANEGQIRYDNTLQKLQFCNGANWIDFGSNPIVISETVINVSCNGFLNGSIIISVNGGTLPYFYQWSNDSNSTSVNNLSAGLYTVSVYDAMNHIAVKTIQVTQPNVLSLTLTTIDATQTGSDGSINLTVTGGTQPYSFVWSNSVTTEDIQNLQPNWYSVSIIDNQSCFIKDSTFINGYFTDSRDNTIYKLKQIGTQIWMAENLNYNAVGSNSCAFGRRYDWATLMNGASSSNTVPSGVQGVCPFGWHVPSVNEWLVLGNYLGGTSVAAGKMKEAGTSHWETLNLAATNSSGFTGLPTEYSGQYAYFYSSYSNASTCWGFYLGYNDSLLRESGMLIDEKYTVRCLKNWV